MLGSVKSLLDDRVLACAVGMQAVPGAWTSSCLRPVARHGALGCVISHLAVVLVINNRSVAAAYKAD